tara:strand:+ start:10526 stop:14125 length:3600 start_codon:yes stop_codon:yes gene_type:complete
MSKYQNLVDTVLKEYIFIEIVARAGGDVVMQQNTEEALSFEAFGNTYTFKDRQAIRTASTRGNESFYGKTLTALGDALTNNGSGDRLKIKDLKKLVKKGELMNPAGAPSGTKNPFIDANLRAWLPTIANLTQENPRPPQWLNYQKTLGDKAKDLRYLALGLREGDDPELKIIWTPSGGFNPDSGFESASTINGAVGGGSIVGFKEFWGSNPNEKRFDYTRDILDKVKSLVREIYGPEELLARKGHVGKLVKEVIEQLKGDLAAAQAQNEVNDALLPASAEGSNGDIVKVVDEKPKLTPFDFQCFLLENISQFVDKRQEDGPYKTLYRNVTKVTNQGDPGNVINTIEHGGRSAYIDEYLNICPDVYSLLTPYIKISRIEYDDKGDIKTENGKPVVKDLKIPSFLTQDDISDILDGSTGRAPGAGIKSFSWSLDGVQPAEVDNNISANLVMYFQSVNDFFNGARSAGQDEPNFLDLIINSPGVRKLQKGKSKKDNKNSQKPCTDDILRSNLHRDYQGNNYRVKICAGWSTPPKAAITALVGNADKASRLIDAIEESKISLFLQMTNHQINFAQNGSLELSVQYQASLAGLLTGKTSNIFDVSSKLIQLDIEREENKIEAVSEGEQSDSDEKVKKEALEEIKQLKNIDRNVKYKKLLKRLYDSRTIYNISINPNELRLPNYDELTPTERQKRVKRRLSDQGKIDFSPLVVNTVILDEINKNAAINSKDLAKAYSTQENKRFDELTNHQKINIPFFFLGDLFDNILEQIKINNGGAAFDGQRPLNFQFFISDVEMIDPLQAFKVKNLDDLIRCGYDLKDVLVIDAITKETPTDNNEINGIYRTMNIGDIPISLDAFQLWFKNNVVKRDKDNYFFLYFVKDVCKELITKALSSKCFGKEFSFQQRFDAQPLTLTKNTIDTPRFVANNTYPATELGKAKAALTCDDNVLLSDLGLILYPTDSHPKDLDGNYVKDLNKGIYHHYLGSACGLVKTLNFSREDQAYLRESRIQKEGALGAEQLRELYSANISLVGNTLYKNGMYIYINPSLMGASREYLDYLGLHGYYMITSVNSKVTPGGFDVDITALHEGVEFKGNKLLPDVDLGGDMGYGNIKPESNPALPVPTKEYLYDKAVAEVGEVQADLEQAARGDDFKIDFGSVGGIFTGETLPVLFGESSAGAQDYKNLAKDIWKNSSVGEFLSKDDEE